MKELISSNDIYHGVLNGDWSINFAQEQLIFLIESNDNPKIRVESIEIIEKLKIRKPTVYSTLESALHSDENSFVRNSAARLICRFFLSKGINSLIWVLQHEKSPLIIKTILELTYHLRNKKYSELRQELNRIFSFISNTVGIVEQEAKFILDLEAIFAQYNVQYEIDLKSYSFFKNLFDQKLKEYWLTIRNSHIEALSFNFFNWNYLKHNPSKYNSISKLIDPNVFFNHLRNHNFDDPIQFYLPDSINSLMNLRKLSLRHNNIAMLTESLYDVTSLQVLDLSHNQIKRISPSILKLKNLESLLIHKNKIDSFSSSLKDYFKTLKIFRL